MDRDMQIETKKDEKDRQGQRISKETHRNLKRDSELGELIS